MARKDDVVKNEETTNLPADLDEAAKAAALAAEEAAKNAAQDDPKEDVKDEPEEKPKAEPKAKKSSSRKVNLDTKLAGKGTFAVGVQAMMRNRINKRG